MKYKIDLYDIDGKWTAVVQDLLVVGEGDNPESATASAIAAAEKAERQLTATGLAVRGRNGSIRLVQSGARRTKDILVEYGIRTILLFMLLGGIYMMVRGDIKAEISQIRNNIAAEAALIREALDGSTVKEDDRAERLRQQAKRINDRLLPIARELRPLVQTLIGDDDAN